MTTATPQSLLSLPPETQPTDAYIILGLAAFESNRAKIKAAAEDSASRLKSVRSTADESVWAIASQWVKDAYSILSDASKKAAYDRKLTDKLAAKTPVADPLAGFLPGRVKQPGLPSGQVTNSASKPTTPTAPQPAPVLPPEMLPVTQNAPQIPIPTVRLKPLSRPRRGMPWFSIFLSLFCLIAIGGLGGLLYVLLRGGLPSIVISSGGVTVAASADTDGDGRAVALPGDVTEHGTKPFDPVMGGLAGDMPPPRPQEMLDDADTAAVGNVPSKTPANSPSMSMAEPITPMMPAPEMPTSEMPTPEMPTPASAPTDEQIKAGDVAIAAIVSAVKQRDWSRMKQLAEDAQAAAASDQQKEQAEMLYQLVDLASFYHGGIKRGLGTLKSGNELDISDDLKVVIVETGPDKLIVRFNGKNKEYTFDTIPLSLANKIARLAMSGDGPTSLAAKHCYHAVAAVATPSIREAAVAELEKITEEMEGTEPAKLVAAIRFLYQP